MLSVVLDADVIVEKDWFLTRPPASALLAAAERQALRLVIPELVVREVIRKRQTKERAALRALRSAYGGIRKVYGPWAPSLTSPEPMENWADMRLRSRLDRNGVHIAELPNVSHEDLVSRALANRKPFDGEGKKGYRDALNWHVVLDEASSGRHVVFVTHNSGDFADPDEGGRLHPDLRDDLTRNGLAPTCVTIISDLDSAARHVLSAGLDLVEHLRRRLERDRQWALGLREALGDIVTGEGMLELDETAVDIDLEESLEWASADIVDAELQDLDDFGSPDVDAAYRTDGDEFTVVFRIPAVALYDVELSTASFWHDPDRVPAGLELSPDERTARVGGSATVTVYVTGRYSDDEQIHDLRPWYITSETDHARDSAQLDVYDRPF